MYRKTIVTHSNSQHSWLSLGPEDDRKALRSLTTRGPLAHLLLIELLHSGLPLQHTLVKPLHELGLELQDLGRTLLVQEGYL